MNETDLLHRVMMAFTKAGARVFRNQSGRGWYGDAWRCPKNGQQITLNEGDVVIRRARPLQAGLCVGASDAIGWNSVEITADMVGRRVAIFTAAETKAKRGKLTDEQARFLAAVKQAGGVAIEARDIEQSVNELQQQTRGKS